LIELVPDRSTYAVRCSSTEKGKTVKALCDVGCLGCGLCVRQCDQGAITLTNNLAHIDYDKCIGCGKCAEKCPAKIIRLR
ncbi:MAG: 4Fe-4S binding protein, partial [Clostridiales bacterium]|nr:4Fe-4S binding protein [Clostridiales bacterium]